MSSELVPVPGERDVALLETTAPDVVEAWLDGRCQNTPTAYLRDIRHFATFLKAPTPGDAIEKFLAVDQVGANRLALAYRAHMTRRDLSSATIARRLVALRSMVTVARLIGHVSWSIDVEGLRIEPRLDRRGPTLVGIQRLWVAAVAAGNNPRARRDRAILSILMTTGLRRGELAALEVDDILPVPARPESLAVRGKGRREKEPVTLPELARVSLAEYLNDRGYTAGPLFHGRPLGAERPQGWRDRPPISGETIRRITRRLAAAAGLPPIRPHGLRHSGATLLLEAGHDVRRVRRWTRHKTLDMVLRYDDERHDVAGELSQDLAARLASLSHIAPVEAVDQASVDRDHPSETGD